AAISLLSVGVFQLAKHWGDLMSLFGKTTPFPDLTQQVKDLEKQLEELGKKEVKFVLDRHQLEDAQRKLDALKKGLAEFEAAQKKQRPGQRESGAAVQRLLEESEAGEPEIARRLAEQRAGEIAATSPLISEAEDRIKRLESDLKAAQEEARHPANAEA